MILLTLVTAAALTHADSAYVTKTRKGHHKAYGKYEITYPILNPSAAPAYQRINAEITKRVRAAHCEADGQSHDMDYSERLEIKVITPDFVSLEDFTDLSCGGAHPSVSRGGLVFDARTGKEENLNVAFGEPAGGTEWSDADFAKYQAAQARVVKYLSTHMSKEDTECFRDSIGGTLEESLAGVSFAYGLEKGAVTIYGEPPHVIYVCAFTVSAPYAEIRDLIEARSPLHQWLSK